MHTKRISAHKFGSLQAIF